MIGRLVDAHALQELPDPTRNQRMAALKDVKKASKMGDDALWAKVRSRSSPVYCRICTRNSVEHQSPLLMTVVTWRLQNSASFGRCGTPSPLLLSASTLKERNRILEAFLSRYSVLFCQLSCKGENRSSTND